MDDDFIVAFDTLYTTNHIQILKAMLRLIPEENQSFVAVIIKYLEFNYTFQLALRMQTDSANFKNNDAIKTEESSYDQAKKIAHITDFLHKILPFCSEREAGIIRKIIQMKETYDSFEQMKPILSMLSQMEGEANGSMDVLKSFLSPEQTELFEIFSEEMKHDMDG